MTDAGVPFAYSEGLREIYFTYLPSNRGDYEAGYIRLSCDASSSVVDTTLAHELGHHLYNIESISNRINVSSEYQDSNLKAPAGGTSYDCEEYVAIGFELFYFGERGVKSCLRKENPKLYNVIDNIHRKYKNK
jgi:hypothetical protein